MKVKNYLWLGVIALSAVFLVNFVFRDRAESVDGVRIGMSRAEVEGIYSGTTGKGSIFVSGVATTFVFEEPGRERRVEAYGAHPEEELGKLKLGWSGVCYDFGFPIVGYGPDERVIWVCGEKRRVGRLPSSPALSRLPGGDFRYTFEGRVAEPREGYCMDGPVGFNCLGGKLKLFVCGEQVLYLLGGSSD